MTVRTAGNTIHHAGIKSVGLLLNVLHVPSIHKVNTINLLNVQTNKFFSVIHCKPNQLVNSIINLVQGFYIYSFLLVKATEVLSQFYIKCFSKSSCMMLCPFHLRLMNFMLSYRIRSCISVAPPQVSEQMSQTVTIIFLIIVLRTWSLNTILLLILR